VTGAPPSAASSPVARVTVDVTEESTAWQLLADAAAICRGAALAALDAAVPAARRQRAQHRPRRRCVAATSSTGAGRDKDSPTNVLSFPAQDFTVALPATPAWRGLARSATSCSPMRRSPAQAAEQGQDPRRSPRASRRPWRSSPRRLRSRGRAGRRPSGWRRWSAPSCPASASPILIARSAMAEPAPDGPGSEGKRRPPAARAAQLAASLAALAQRREHARFARGDHRGARRGRRADRSAGSGC